MSDEFVLGLAVVFVPRDVLLVAAALAVFAGLYWLAHRADVRNAAREARPAPDAGRPAGTAQKGVCPP